MDFLFLPYDSNSVEVFIRSDYFDSQMEKLEQLRVEVSRRLENSEKLADLLEKTQDKEFIIELENLFNLKNTSLVQVTDIPIEKNKRNYRKQDIHLKGARAIQEINDPEFIWRNQEGRPSKENLVKEYLEENPNDSPTEIAKNLKISRTTVYKYI